MFKDKILRNIIAGVVLFGSVWMLTGCEKGLVYEEAPESTYSQVAATRFDVRAREVFEDKIYAVNWQQWVDAYLNTQLIGTSDESWTNETGAAVTLSNGETVQPGETVTGSIVEQSDASAPGGTLYVIRAEEEVSAPAKPATKEFYFVGPNLPVNF